MVDPPPSLLRRRQLWIPPHYIVHLKIVSLVHHICIENMDRFFIIKKWGILYGTTKIQKKSRQALKISVKVITYNA